MPRRFIRRYLPHPHTIRDHHSLRMLRTRLHDPNLWHLNRHSVSVAMFVGVFVAFIPLPLQMLIAAVAAIALRCNLALAVALVWITNPLTMPPIYYATYRLGALMLGLPPQTSHFELSLNWIEHQMSVIWEPLLLGSFSAGLVLGSLALVLTRVAWRIGVQLKWRQRQRQRRNAKRDHS
ncbi:MAG: DUF2062 domain-containing protein [Pseudomonadales bacterium]|nr:DUF2062 domain-containing protein [Pseudomonadales bacterium]